MVRSLDKFTWNKMADLSQVTIPSTFETIIFKLPYYVLYV